MNERGKILLEIALVAFALNFVWEILHSPLYSVADGVVPWFYLLTGTLIDVVYVLILYFIVALLLGDRIWIIKPSFKWLALMSFLGIILASINELAALTLNLWQYRASMPLFFGRIGLSPVLQMAVLAPLAVLISSKVRKLIFNNNL